MSDETVLLTGATGFLGHSLAAQLVAQGYCVHALARPTSDTRHLVQLGVDLVHGDVRDAAAVVAAAAGCRLAVHAAGLFRLWGEASEFESTNVEGTAHVLEAARRCRVERLVHVSTIAVVGAPPAALIDEDTPCQPADAYQRSKLDGENLVRRFHAATGLPAVIVRPGAFYGPWGRYAFNRLFFEDPLKGLLIQVHGGRRITFPAFVPDVARAIVAALRMGRPGEVYNVCGECLPHRTVNQVVSRLARLPAWRVNVPERAMLNLAGWMARRARRTGREPYYPLALAPYVFMDWQVSSARAQAELGFRPTSFEEGARQTLEWYWSSGLFRAPRGRAAQPAAQTAAAPATQE